MTDSIDVALQALATELAFPPTPDLRASVERAIARPARRSWWPSAWPRAVALAVLATLLIAAAATALVIAVPGLRLTFLPALPSPDIPDEPLATRLALGRPVDPETIAVGIPAALGTPDEAYVIGDDRVISLVYAADDRLATLGDSGIGLLVQVIEGALDREQVEKLVASDPGTSVAAVQVGDADGFWITGPPHLVRIIDPNGGPSTLPTRLAGDTLVWESGGVLYRMESAMGLEETLRIAETIP
ncbi:MAG TPA: hypothetical protein VIH24_02250 [Candidatus Limnocylindria bacterium]